MRAVYLLEDFILIIALTVVGLLGYVTFINPPTNTEMAYCQMIAGDGGFDYTHCILDLTVL